MYGISQASILIHDLAVALNFVCIQRILSAGQTVNHYEAHVIFKDTEYLLPKAIQYHYVHCSFELNLL